jgi:hypothetical protein
MFLQLDMGDSSAADVYSLPLLPCHSAGVCGSCSYRNRLP